MAFNDVLLVPLVLDGHPGSWGALKSQFTIASCWRRVGGSQAGGAPPTGRGTWSSARRRCSKERRLFGLPDAIKRRPRCDRPGPGEQGGRGAWRVALAAIEALSGSRPNAIRSSEPCYPKHVPNRAAVLRVQSHLLRLLPLGVTGTWRKEQFRIVRKIKEKLVLQLRAEGLSGRAIAASQLISRNSVASVLEASDAARLAWDNVADVSAARCTRCFYRAVASRRACSPSPTGPRCVGRWLESG